MKPYTHYAHIWTYTSWSASECINCGKSYSTADFSGCPMRKPVVAQQNQQGLQPPLPGHQQNVRSSVSLGIDNCSCGTGVWLYDPFINKFNCVSCGKSQSKSDNSNTSIKSSGCCHEWIKYTGLNEQFEYCKICDEKRK